MRNKTVEYLQSRTIYAHISFQSQCVQASRFFTVFHRIMQINEEYCRVWKERETTVALFPLTFLSYFSHASAFNNAEVCGMYFVAGFPASCLCKLQCMLARILRKIPSFALAITYGKHDCDIFLIVRNSSPQNFHVNYTRFFVRALHILLRS